MNTQVKTWLGVAIIIIIAATTAVFVWRMQKQDNVLNSILPGKNRACTMEAKLCPDGSSVGRSGPNCEFAPCPKGDNLVGNDKDENGCIGSAGYIWCEIKQKCIKTWEEGCVDDKGMKIYRNKKLGFEIKIPVSIDDKEVKAVESGNIVWFAIENNSNYKKHLNQIQSSASEFEKVQGVPWAILLRSVNDDQELEQFIKDRYGKDCKLGLKSESSQAGIYDVDVKSGESENPGEGCFLNWVLKIKYSPEKHLVAAWDIGQDVTFVSLKKPSVGYAANYDFDMINSFKFID